MARTNSNNDSPKGADVSKRKFSQSQYDMLKRCSENEDISEWNEWRRTNPLKDVLLEEVQLGGFSLQGAFLGGANLQGADLFHANLQGAVLSRSNLQGANFFGTNLQAATLFRANLQSADLRQADLNQANMLAVKFDSMTLCRILKGKDFYGCPVFKRFVEDSDYLEDFKNRHPAIYRIWFILSDCGRSLALWAAWSLLFAVLFAHKFFALGPGAIEVSKLPWNFATLVYYSVVTFTTLGFGDVVPKTNAAAWWVLAEVITGYVMLGGLISIFANKLARRS